MKSAWQHTISLTSRGSRYHLLVAITLVSVIPMLSLVFVLWTQFGLHDVYPTWVPLTVSGIALVIGIIGYCMLRRYPTNIVKLRDYLQQIISGELPDRVILDDPEDDIGAIERYMNTVIEQMRAKVRKLEEQLRISKEMQQTIELQSRELVEAERQRVMLETLGAACHHIGQPATVLRISVNLLKKHANTPESRETVRKCEAAIDGITEVLDKLRHVSEYRTVPYMTYDESIRGLDEKIIDIDQKTKPSSPSPDTVTD